jgi:putative membrane protein
MALRTPPSARISWAWPAAGVVIATEVPYPLVHGTAHDVLTVSTVIVFAATSVAHALSTRGTRYAGVLVLVAAGGGLVAELVGVHTGVPFGRYRYLGGLGPTVGLVPLAVAAAWLMMAHPARVVAETLARGPAARVLVMTVGLASWDVFLDPQMVAARHWRWSDPRPHLPGVSDVPLSNFGGWLLIAAVMSALLEVATRARLDRRDRPLLALWLWTWLSSTLANLVFFGRPAVAAWGFAAMAVVGVPLLVRMRRPA